MKCLVAGSTLSAAYTSVLMGDLGHLVEWHFNPRYPLSLRPLRISEKVLTSLRRLLRYHSLSKYLDQLNPNDFGCIDAERLWGLLTELGSRMSVQIQSKELLELPKTEMQNQMNLLAAEPEEIAHWPRMFFNTGVSELYLSYQARFRSESFASSQFFQGALAGGAFGKVDGTLLFIEALSEHHFALSLVARTRYLLEKTLMLLNKPQSQVPLAVKTLLMSAHKEAEHYQKIFLSPAAHEVGQEWLALGPALGAFSALSLHQESSFLEQALQFRDFVSAGRVSSTDWVYLRAAWVKKQQRRQALMHASSRIWERFLGSEQKLRPFSEVKDSVGSEIRKLLNYPL